MPVSGPIAGLWMRRRGCGQPGRTAGQEEAAAGELVDEPEDEAEVEDPEDDDPEDDDPDEDEPEDEETASDDEELDDSAAFPDSEEPFTAPARLSVR